ncbi:MAG: RecA domain protein, partial [Candidatus Sulfotelmatobacter sp.]|nr:RecA domain protein [Candidatus Sulfotelmatobacter sp.]
SAVFSTSAAHGRPFVFDGESVAEVCLQPTGAELFGGRPPQRIVPRDFKDSRLAGITPASRLAARPTPEMVSSGIAAMDMLTGGLPRGCLTEICGPASSGRTTLLLSALAASTRRGECCVVVDASDALDPQSVVDAGVELDRLLWVRCGDSSQRQTSSSRREESDKKKNFVKPELPQAEHSLEQLLRAADLLLESGGFGLIALDLGDLPPQTARRIPLTTWFRFRRAVEHTPTVLLAIERQSIAGSCSSLLIKLGLSSKPISNLESAAQRRKNASHGASPGLADQNDEGPGGRKNTYADEQSTAQFSQPTHTQLLTALEIKAEIGRSRLECKPARSAEITFASKTAWAG